MLSDIVDFGDLLIIANKGSGKTNSLMQLTRELRQVANSRVIIFETFPKWCNEFDLIPYLFINDEDVQETSRAIELSEYDYFVRTSSDYTILRGNEIQTALKHNKDLLFTLAVEDTDRISFFISSIVCHFYRKHYLTAYKYGIPAINDRTFFICEEAQNIFDSSIISKRIFNKLRKMFSETRNLKIHFVMASQRIQDLNTKIRGRTQFLIGKVNIDDYDLKVNRILRNSQHRQEVLNLPVGQLLNVNSDELIQFDKFNQIQQPYEFIIPPQPQPEKPKGLLEKLVQVIKGSA